MFLNENNGVAWRKLAIASAAAIGLAILGFIGVDTFLQPFFRHFDLRIWQWFDTLGDWKVLAVASFAVCILSFLCGRFVSHVAYRASRVSANAFCAIILAEAAAGVLKICVGRMRPVIFDALGRTGFNPFAMGDIWHSFPSGHSAAAFAFLVSIGLVFPKIKPAAWVMAVIAGISRICAGAHFPSDVIFGAFIGMAAADLVFSLREKK